MKTVNVSASRDYDILIERGLIARAGEYIEKALSGKPRLAVITDDMVDGLHSEKLSQALSDFEVVKFVFKNGEESKNINTYGEILNFLSKNGFTRSDAVVAFGGGVCGDLAGFAASTFLRGIRFVQIPTTLLAMVDSSVGGKTAIDLPAGKNLCGTFWQPSLVLCDPELLSTLPEDIFADGMAEVIKYAVIGDSELFNILTEKNAAECIEDVIYRCVSQKRDIVVNDERDTGVRALLNFGHTAAHGIEKLSDYKISHGRAVAMGMVVAARGAAHMGICEASVAERIEGLCQSYGLSDKCPYSARELSELSLSDKKRDGGSISLILPEEIGRARICKTDVNDLCEFFARGLGNI